MTFAKAVKTQKTRTTNGMKAWVASGNACVDLFYKIGSARGQNIVPDFIAAYEENQELALRIALWARDVRGGAGERGAFRQILKHLQYTNKDHCAALMLATPEVGRWDDLLVMDETYMKAIAFSMIKRALLEGNGLAAKWMPRKGSIAYNLRKYLEMSPKQYRKTLVELTKVVETQMCNKDWNNINFEHVPSLAMARYRKAFYRNAKEPFEKFVLRVKEGDAKVNASAVYPYDILKGKLNIRYDGGKIDRSDEGIVVAQWEALPNYMSEGAPVLPMIDTSGSMCVSVGPATALEIAVGLGLYVADKNKGAFKDMFLTFSASPELQIVKGNVLDKASKVLKSNWGMNTNLMAAFDRILEVATKGKVKSEDMPKTLIIFSDMQFDQCARFNGTAFKGAKKRYKEAGYDLPLIVFWNLAGGTHDNMPVKFDKEGVAMVSGFSPSLMKGILAARGLVTPEKIMLDTVMVDRYQIKKVLP